MEYLQIWANYDISLEDSMRRKASNLFTEALGARFTDMD